MINYGRIPVYIDMEARWLKGQVMCTSQKIYYSGWIDPTNNRRVMEYGPVNLSSTDEITKLLLKWEFSFVTICQRCLIMKSINFMNTYEQSLHIKKMRSTKTKNSYRSFAVIFTRRVTTLVFGRQERD